MIARHGRALVGTVALWAQLPVFAVFLARRAQLAARGRSNPMVPLLVLVPAACWHLGIVAFDDDRIFNTLAETMRGPLEEYDFTEVAFTDSTSHYRALHKSVRDVEDDRHRSGFALRNSEVGSAALSLDDFWLRLVCSNGLMVPVDGKRLLYRTHRAIEDEQLAAAMVIAIARLPKRWDVVTNMLVGAKHASVPHPDDAVLAALDGVTLPKALIDSARETVLYEKDSTRFGVVQAITAVARQKTTDPDLRFAMERAAGEYLAAA